MKNIYKYILPLLLALTLSGCALSFDNAPNINPNYREVNLELSSPYSAFSHDIKNSLKYAGIQVSSMYNKNLPTLDVSSVSSSSYTASIFENGSEAQALNIYSTSLDIKMPNNGVYIYTIKSHMTYLTNSENPLANSTQEAYLAKYKIKDLANEVVSKYIFFVNNLKK
ncbi:MAG: hypothetical protein R3Y52_00650 [Psittacicella sp.]